MLLRERGLRAPRRLRVGVRVSIPLTSMRKRRGMLKSDPRSIAALPGSPLLAHLNPNVDHQAPGFIRRSPELVTRRREHRHGFPDLPPHPDVQQRRVLMLRTRFIDLE